MGDAFHAAHQRRQAVESWMTLKVRFESTADRAAGCRPGFPAANLREGLVIPGVSRPTI